MIEMHTRRDVAMRTVEVVFYREGKAWVAQALNVDIASFGDTREDARAAIKEALELYFEDAPDAEVIQVAEAQVEAVSVETI
jgi:predicted RNase H-like HicB family nuclease